MQRTAMPVQELLTHPVGLFERWLLLTAGDFKAGAYNAMTISWGSTGVVWGKPFIQVFVRPTRYTREFMDKYDTFTVSAFPAAHRGALDLLGSKSGRELDKIRAAGLTPEPAIKVAAPAYAEAELVVECRKIYFQDLNPANFLDAGIESQYDGDYHRAFFGEILAVSGVASYWAD